MHEQTTGANPDREPMPIPTRVEDLTGQKFNYLRVTGFAGSDGNNAHWWCRCICGVTVKAVAARLKNGDKKSCGCLYVASIRAVGWRNSTHGRSRTPEYSVWLGMKKRCYNQHSKDYPRYGGRGIAVCDRWRESFEAFFADVGFRPAPGYTLERIRNDEDYKPGNVRWATRREQARNLVRNRVVALGDEKMTLVEWAEKTGIRAGTIKKRLDAGWSPERALTSPSTRPA